MAKKKKSAGGSSEKPKRKSSSKQSRAKRILAARTDDNPFETIWSRRKSNVLGLKRKGEERRVGLARSRAVDKRRKTLLPEYEQSGKSSVFVDKRIGEKSEGLEEFDKAIMRFQRERQMKVNRKSKYNLSDGEEEELVRKDDFEDDLSLEDEEEDGHAAEGDFLPFDEAGPTHSEADLENGVERGNKTKREVMKEVMLKDKYFKARCLERIESIYDTDPFSQSLGVDPVAYRYVVGEPNKGQHHGLGSTLTAVCHLPPKSRGSTSEHTDDAGSGAGMMSQTSQLDESFFRRLKDLETRERDRQAEITRMREKIREEMRAEAEAWDRQLIQLLDERHQLIQLLDERHQRLREEIQIRDDQLVQSITAALDTRMLRHMMTICREQRRGPGDYDSDIPPRDPPALPLI